MVDIVPHRTENCAGQKGRLFEGGIRVPFILSWPGHLPAGQTYDHPVMHIDILPTVLAAAGQELPANLDGENLLPFLRSEESGPPHEILCWGRGDRFAVRKGPWKLVQERGTRDSVIGRLLFNLPEDGAEQNNLAAQQKQIVQQLLQVRQDWQAGLR